MPDSPQWSQFQAPGGQADNSWVGPVANAHSDAAKLAASPITRVFEQLVQQRFAERTMQGEQQFASAQAERARQDHHMLQREQDAAALARVEAQIAAQERQAKTELELAGAGGLAARDLTTPLQEGGGYAPLNGTGAWNTESLLRLPAQQGPSYAPIGDAQARALGKGGVEAVNATRATAQLRAQTDREQVAKVADAAAAAEAARAQIDVTQHAILGDESLDPASKVRLLVRLPGDPKGAYDEYQAIAKEQRDVEAEKAKKALEVKAKKESGVVSRKIAGVGDVDFPISANAPNEMKKPLPFSQIPLDAKRAFQMAAQTSVAKDLVGRGQITAADAQNLFEPGSQFAGVYDREVAERASSIAEQFGWKRDPKVEKAAQAQAAQDESAPTVQGMRQFVDTVQSTYGITAQDLQAFNESLKGLPREEAAKRLKARFDAQRAEGNAKGWSPDPTPPPPASLLRGSSGAPSK